MKIKLVGLLVIMMLVVFCGGAFAVDGYLWPDMLGDKLACVRSTQSGRYRSLVLYDIPSRKKIKASGALIVDLVPPMLKALTTRFGKVISNYQVFFSAHSGLGGISDIYQYDVKSGSIVNLTNTPTVYELQPFVLGNKLVYTAPNFVGNNYIILKDLNTGTTQQITTQQSNVTDNNPAIWSNYVVWLRIHSDTGIYELMKHNLASGNQEVLATSPENIYFINAKCVSGKYVVWVEEKDNKENVYLYDLSNSTKYQITNDGILKRSVCVITNNNIPTIIWSKYNSSSIYYKVGVAGNQLMANVNAAENIVELTAYGIKYFAWSESVDGQREIFSYNRQTNAKERWIY
ncbi:MAG: hypothetical protein KKB81_07235 [Candidatus Margulisbacteria bacterium]|nr:hypothetical protein [Candidatus Margulisiibacteriota bacterium]MBU1021148.1 hypothetical protein [Candidatus Margulisiibacteriota bacterium]MBU1729754.1 hypothetical protein [Candidatus Margulisiibacteriota bacterium]MBU1955255.1 hypothetical protein [Candidatus Margulisiibacteriota bacterium]